MINDFYSDDVMCAVYLNMVEKENHSPTFKHPHDLDDLTDLQTPTFY